MNFEEYKAMALGELNEVFERVHLEDMQPVLDALKGAKKIVCYGGGREGLALKFFAMRLMHLGLDAHWAWDDTAPACGEGDVFLVSHGAGSCGHIVYTAEQGKKTGAKLVAITCDVNSPLGKMADEKFYLPAHAYGAKSDAVKTQQAMGNLYEQCSLLLFDMMVAVMKDQMGMSAKEMEARHRNYE